jgi:hypothetical protein
MKTIKMSLLKILAVGLLTSFLFSCPDPKPSPDAEEISDSETAAEYIYNASILTGNITYTLDGVPGSGTVTSVRSVPEPGKQVLEFSFDEPDVKLELWLEYTDSSYILSNMSDNDYLVLTWIIDRKSRSLSAYSRPHTLTVTTSADPMEIDTVNLHFEAGSAITATTPAGALSITALSISADLTKTGVTAVNYTTPDLNAIRHYNTLSIIRKTSVTDRYAALQADPESTLPLIVSDLLEGQTDPVLKMKILHDWVCEYLYYDWYAYTEEVPWDVWPEYSLVSRKTVCSGYAKLFEKVCGLAGLHARYAVGIAKGYSYDPEAEELPGHAWNIVRINGELYLMDSTWNSQNTFDENSAWITGNLSTYYCFVPMDVAICSHLPDNPACQGLDPVVSLATFNSYPMTRMGISGINYNLYDNGLFLADFPGVRETVNGAPAGLVVDVGSTGTIMTFTLMDYAQSDEGIKKTRDAFCWKEGNTWNFEAFPGNEGYQTLTINKRVTKDPAPIDPNENPYSYIHLGMLRINTIAGSTAVYPYPKLYTSYYTLQANLVSPRQGTLAQGETVSVQVRVPGGQMVRIKDQTTAAYSPVFAETDDLFTLSYPAVSGSTEHSLYYNTDGGSTYYSLLLFGEPTGTRYYRPEEEAPLDVKRLPVMDDRLSDTVYLEEGFMH